ncbi:MAG TPA: serine--tRNA ligase, partial [Spirochaetales bacterium]|nr:serine--tRNA ligase [Spirochaetales bacterium]
MLELKFIKDNLDAVKANIAKRFMKADPDAVVALADERSASIQALDEKRRRRNEVADAMKSKLEPNQRAALIEEGKQLKEHIAAIESRLEAVEKELSQALSRIPNMAHPDAPEGKEDKDNLEVKRSGQVPVFSFEPRDHVALGSLLDI